jgi:hypothetical protein
MPQGDAGWFIYESISLYAARFRRHSAMPPFIKKLFLYFVQENAFCFVKMGIAGRGGEFRPLRGHNPELKKPIQVMSPSARKRP